MPLELVALLLGVLTGLIAVAPFRVFTHLSTFEHTWFYRHQFEANAIALGFSLFWLIGAITVCFFVAEAVLAWFGFFAICTMLAGYLVSVLQAHQAGREK